MKFKFEINDFQNDATIGLEEESTCFLLRDVAEQIEEDGATFGILTDANGNAIGNWTFYEK